MDTTEDFSPYRSDGKLHGFVCVVTGASQPVGQAIIKELAAHGAASIYACDKATIPSTYLPLVTTLATCHPNTNLIPYPFPVTAEDETLTLIDEVLAAFGRLDVWICAPPAPSLSPPGPLASTTADDLDACLRAHAIAPFFALKHAPPAMAKLLTAKLNYPNAAPKGQVYGSIVVVVARSGGSVQTIAAHAALGVVRAGVGALRGSGVRVNCIGMGRVGGEGGDGGGPGGEERAGTPQEIARVAGFLASGFSSYVNGANLVVDGGASCHVPMTAPRG
ncbi:hypothetical protein B0H67DRAFT_83129 [Lasiosphaeris hirsuta]|uniref:Peroxisomal trans-2-enoyl-CoA reductase n=1 Tax=Lasiosphaeris hirsuta TaxID=260670 RepID=A0AA40BCE4_9PEZI|nr:hypothetical protein B0H67DRAFT_83129 [Lasiosphaeris hirsuta]